MCEAVLRWATSKLWQVTTTHVVVKRPRKTAIAIADVTEVVGQYHLPDGDTFVIGAPADWLREARRR